MLSQARKSFHTINHPALFDIGYALFIQKPFYIPAFVDDCRDKNIVRSLTVENDMTPIFMTLVAFAYIVTPTPQIGVICNER